MATEASIVATQPLSLKKGVQKNMQMLRAKVLALRAFQGLIKTIQTKGLSPSASCASDTEPLEWAFPAMETLVGSEADLTTTPNFSEQDLEMLRDATNKLQVQQPLV
eukprot:212405-Rhodomonas_salina.1